jgi:hypothetical protein
MTLRSPKLTKAQQRSILELWNRSEEARGTDSYLAFRRRARYVSFLGCVTIEWCGMIVGIESDGYMHT